MSEPVRGIVVGHGAIANALLEAVEQIAGVSGDLIAVNNRDMTPEALGARLEEMTRSGPTIFFVDLPSGSCAHAARKVRVQRRDVAVVCGVNLPLLLDFVFHRDLPLDEVLERLRSHFGISIENADDAGSAFSS